MRKPFTFLILLTTFVGFSQTVIQKSSIDSGGAGVTVGTTTIFYTLGEVAVQENTNGSIHISEGFISPDIIHSLGLEAYSILEGIRIYPNPTTDIITIEFKDIDTYEIIMYDHLGKQMERCQAEQTDEKSLDISNYSSGVYVVLIKSDTAQSYRTYQVIKQ
jgi:hypothetical protein